mmetsp:Transcript_75190/g.220422  ORF Transcript_75190/g.220422 Transcript_75190/m.220422 type:complete len:220 (+) Transcript_75190:94-753(+)
MAPRMPETASAGKRAAAKRVLRPPWKTRPRWTDVVAVRPSKIKGGGMGLFALQSLPRGFDLPEPYKGRRLTEKQLSRVKDSSYVFLFSRGNLEECAAIDARAACKDNPLRYANGARTPCQRKRINLRSHQRGKNVYFITTRQVAAGEELLLDYGPDYWRGMRYQTRERELGREMRQLKAALAAAPEGSRRRRDLEEQVERVQFSKDQLEDFEDSEADSD